MTYLASRLIAGARAPAEPPLHHATTFSQAFAVGVTNPLQILWWLTAGLAFAYLGGLVLFVGLFGAIAVWIVAFPWAIHAGVRHHPEVVWLVPWISGGIMVGFAVYFAVLAL